jgi:hypothetical protein
MRGVWRLYNLPPARRISTKISISVIEPTKHRRQNASVVKRFVRMRSSIIYVGNHIYATELHINIKREEIQRTDIKTFLVGVTHIPGSHHTIQMSVSTKRTNNNRNAACVNGWTEISDLAQLESKIASHVGSRKRTIMSKPSDPGIRHPQRTSKCKA